MNATYPDALATDAAFRPGARGAHHDAERAVIGALLQWPESFTKLPGSFTSECFESVPLAQMFDVVRTMAYEGAVVNMTTALERYASTHRSLNTGELSDLASTVDHIPSSAALDVYAGIVREAYRGRLVHREARQTARDIHHGEEATSVAQRASTQLADLAKVESDQADDLSSYTAGHLRHLDAVAHGMVQEEVIATGIASLDSKLSGGFRPGELIVAGGMPGMGKTAFMLGLMQAAAYNDYGVGGFFLEMTAPQMSTRWYAMGAGVPLPRMLRPELRTESDRQMLAEVESHWPDLTVKADFRANVTVDDIAVKAERWKFQCRETGRPLKLLCIDYLQIMGGIRSGHEPSDLAAITKNLKNLAKRLHCAVLLLSQVNERAVMKRKIKIPTKADLLGSGGAARDADVILFPYRPWMDLPEPKAGEEREDALIAVDKQRMGPPGHCPCFYEPRYCRYTDGVL